jgi:hypothetical protein
MEINGKQITFDTRPKHGAVTAVRNIETMVLERFVDITKLDQNTNIEDLVKDMMKSSPEFKATMMDVQASKHIDQTIMLSAKVDGKDMTYDMLSNLKEEMYEDEYITMFEESKKALGDKEAEDFFGNYRGLINSQVMAKMMSRNRKS